LCYGHLNDFFVGVRELVVPPRLRKQILLFSLPFFSLRYFFRFLNGFGWLIHFIVLIINYLCLFFILKDFFRFSSHLGHSGSDLGCFVINWGAKISCFYLGFLIG